MNNLIPRVCIAGVCGRMGRELVKVLCASSDKVVLTAGLTSSNSKLCGTDVGLLVGLNEIGVIICDNILDIKDEFDVLIDFTTPETTIEYVKFCCCHNKNIVIGTTGFADYQKELICKMSQHIGIVFSSNFSIGINVMLKILEKVTKIMGMSSDINITDIHHRNKIDIPSGTSLMIKECIMNTLKDIYLKCRTSSDNYFCLSNNNNVSFRKYDIDNNVSMSSVRAGDIIGEHIVSFFSDGERLEVIHKASNRSIYANGAIFSALWLTKDKIGLFNMLDVLNLSKF